ncbi:hypothetical protein LQ952_13450, partial [Ectothiorhodospira sp. B14B]|nr:hypothetical protein [Ectothiorhodospira lacustris]
MPQVPKILLMLMLVPALFTIGACSVSLERDPPVRMTYLMEAKRPALQPSGPAVGSLAMGTVRVAPEFSTRGLIYRMDDTRYVSDFHHDWFAPVR